MASPARTGGVGGSAGGRAGSHRGIKEAGAGERACGERAEWAGAGKPNSQEPGSLVEELSYGRRHPAREGVGLAEYLHVNQEPGGVADCEEYWERWRGAADCDCASVNCRDFGGEAVSRMEWGDQYFGVVVVSAGDGVPATAFERAQATGYYPGGCGVRGDDADWSGVGGAAARSYLSTGDIGDESLRHGAVD